MAAEWGMGGGGSAMGARTGKRELSVKSRKGQENSEWRGKMARKTGHGEENVTELKR